MVSISRLFIVLLCAAQAISACATLESAQEDEHLKAICAFKHIEGRIDLVPAGPAAHTIRVVTLDRAMALSELQKIDRSASQGIAKVRVESPLPMLALILELEETSPAIAASLAWSPFPLALVVSAKHPDIEAIKAWAEKAFVRLIEKGEGASGAPDIPLDPEEKVDLRGFTRKAIDDQLAKLPSTLDELGSAWVLGTLNRPTLDALRTFAKRGTYPLHIVSYEHLRKPPTDAPWRRRCLNIQD